MSDSLGTGLDLDISQAEITKLSYQNLKNNEDPGIDKIRNEILKCGKDISFPT